MDELMEMILVDLREALKQAHTNITQEEARSLLKGLRENTAYFEGCRHTISAVLEIIRLILSRVKMGEESE